MTHDPTTDPRAADELVSAVLDGEASADERARVEGDADLAARLAAFRSVAAQVASVPASSEARREEAIARALAVVARGGEGGADEGELDPASGPPAALVVPLAARRGRPRWLPVAAAVLVALLIPAVVLAWNRTTGTSTSGDVAASVISSTVPEAASSEAAPDGATSDGAGTSRPADSSSAPPRSTTTTATTATGPGTDADAGSAIARDLGTMRSSAALGDAVSSRLSAASSRPGDGADDLLPNGPPTTSSITPSTAGIGAEPGAGVTTTTVAAPRLGSAPAASPCETALRVSSAGLGALLLQASATYRGRAVLVYAFAPTPAVGPDSGAGPDGDATADAAARAEIFAVAPDTCAVVEHLSV